MRQQPSGSRRPGRQRSAPRPVRLQLPAGVRPGARRRSSQTRETKPAPKGDAYRDALAQAYKEWKGLTEGKNADYIPVLAKVDPSLFGIALVTVQGAVYEVGGSRSEFSIQSVSKPFTLARAVEGAGWETVQKRIGVNATGQPFNSILAIELFQSQKRPPPGNPFVNAGAIATVDVLPAANATQKWDVILGMYSAFAGRPLSVNEEVYKSESETNTHNRAIVALLKDYEVVKGDPAEALDLYTRQCSVNVNARDLAMMGATLANGGRNPFTNQQVISARDRQQGAGGDGHGRPLRDHRRLAGDHRGAGQERRGRRHRRRHARSVRDRHLRPAAGRGRQQRPGPEGDREHHQAPGRWRVRLAGVDQGSAARRTGRPRQTVGWRQPGRDRAGRQLTCAPSVV